MTSAFIIEVNSQLRPDPNDEAAALLRVLIYKIDNTTFGNDPPTLPQWTGPPHMVVQVQAILFTSLTASLFSAFLAMLGKQWLNQYASIDMRGSAIERSQNRQRKLDGIVTWYFDHVMESLPLMLQAALLLLGCALSLYFWEINTTVASVVIAVTSFGILSYLFIVFVGAASVSCPYQTPGALILRRVLDTIPYHLRDVVDCIAGVLSGVAYPFLRAPDLFRHITHICHRIPHLPGTLYLTLSTPAKESLCCFVLNALWGVLKTAQPMVSAVVVLLHVPGFPVWLSVDACRVVVWAFIVSARAVRQASEQQTTVLDQRCILWTLRTSLDGPVRLSTLNYLATTTLVDLDLTLVVDCFDILFGCIKSDEDTMVITQGMEQLTTASSLCCLHTISHLITIDPTSRVLENTRRRHGRYFAPWTEFEDLPVFFVVEVIYGMLYRVLAPHPSGRWVWQHLKVVQWKDYKSPNDEHSLGIIARALVVISRFEYRDRGSERVPRWLLRFALHFLAQSPPPPTSTVVSCMSIIAIDLGCDPPTTATSDDRCVRMGSMTPFLMKTQDATG